MKVLRPLTVALSGLIFVSCALTPPVRSPASVAGEPQPDFWVEYRRAKPGSNPADPLSDNHQMGVFLKWMRADSIAAFKALRDKAPVLRIEGVGDKKTSVVVLTGTSDIFAVLRDQKNFSNDPESRAGDGSPMITSGDGASGAAGLLLSRISSASQGSFQETVRATVARVLDEQMYVGTNRENQFYGRVELVNQIGRRVPAMINDAIFGFQGLELKEVTKLSRGLEDDLILNPDRNAQVAQEARVAMKDISDFTGIYLRGGVKTGTALEAGRQDILAANIDLQAPSERLGVQKVIAGLVGGVEITQTAAAHALDELLRQGKVAEAHQVASGGDDELLKAYFNEALRFQPVRPYVLRSAKRETTLPSGTSVPAGALIIVATQAAMFDPSVVRAPTEFRVDRPETLYFHFRQSGTPQVRDVASEIEAFEIFRALVMKPGLRRVEGASGSLDHRTIFKSDYLKETYRYSFPEQFSLEFDVPKARGRLEIPNKDYAYEEYLKDFDRVAFRNCLGGLAKFTTDEKGQLIEKPVGLIGKVGAILRSFEINRLNRTRENKHLLFCRMPAAFRACIAEKKVHILRPEEIRKHEAAAAACEGSLSSTEKAFYRTVFFGAPPRPDLLSLSQAKRPADPFYDFEDELGFYDRYRARESMMNPGGFSLPPGEMLFYVRLNIDFRMCLGAPVLKNKFSGGLLGATKEEMYPKCKVGVWNPQTHKREGELSILEQYYYEKIMLGSQLSYEQVRDRELGRR